MASTRVMLIEDDGDRRRAIARDLRAAGVVVDEATSATAEDHARTVEPSADTYLVHPVEEGELLAAVRAVIRHRDEVRTQGLFLATLGHDLRNPIATMATGLEVLGMSTTLSDCDRETLARLDRALGRMTGMVEQLVAFTERPAP